MFLLAVVVAVCCAVLWVRRGTATSHDVTPLPLFDWRATKPRRLRPFKPKYNLTMGITYVSASESLEMDCNYHARILERRETMAQHPDVAIGENDAVLPAVDELYVWIFRDYLPARFPTMFQRESQSVTNLVTGESIPLAARAKSSRGLLTTLGAHVDEDFLLLLPAPDGDGYTLQAVVACCPSGFDVRQKMHLKLRDIHGPVPGYKEKLLRSMDRFFDRIEPGTFVRRENWSITTHDRLFSPDENHLHEGATVPDDAIDLDKTNLRCELQTLYRLPQSRAIVFGIKTYLDSIAAIRAEGSGPALSEAIDGLLLGNVPRMNFYKKGVVWGERVKAFLQE